MIKYFPTDQLKPHPLNEKYFGKLEKEQEEILLKSIKERGIFHTLVVTEDGTILSGHQRWLIAKKLGIKELPCRVLKVDPDSEEAEMIILEANMGQRVLSPEVYRRCWEGYENLTSRKNFEAKLIPEFKQALKEGKLSIPLARAIAKFSEKEQKDFISLIELQMDEIYQVKVENLYRALKEEKQKIVEFEQKIKVKEEEIEGFKNKYKKLKIEKEKILEEKERKEFEISKLLEELELKQKELEDLHRNPPPEIQRKLEEKQKEINRILEQKENKEMELKQWKLKYQEIKENADNLYRLLQQERKEKRELERKFTKELNEKISKIKKEEEEKRKRLETQCFAPLYARFTAFLDFVMETFEEIIGGSEELSLDEKKSLVNKLKDVKMLLNETIDTLTGKNNSVKYDYEEDPEKNIEMTFSSELSDPDLFKDHDSDENYI